eukprot:3506177-Prorocentrum_lima.AAC.1
MTWIDAGERRPARLEYQADPRHYEVLFLQLGIPRGSRGVVIPFEKVLVTPNMLEAVGADKAALF